MKNANNLLRHRMNLAALPMPDSNLDRSRRLKSLQVTERKLMNHEVELRAMLAHNKADLEANSANLSFIRAQMEELIPEDRPVVTEHAMLRYIERYLGMDMEKIHQMVLELPDTDKKCVGQTVLTVYPDEEDHLNLAENEGL